MRIKWNSPTILTFTTAAFVAMLIGTMTNDWFTSSVCTLRQSRNFHDPMFYVRPFTYTLGHANWSHLLGNFTFILLIGPILEERHGKWGLARMILITALVTAVLFLIFFPANSSLLGASGIVFMMIVLGSLSSARSGDGLPLTFLLVALVFIGREVVNSVQTNNISEFAHITGGVCGFYFGWGRKRV